MKKLALVLMLVVMSVMAFASVVNAELGGIVEPNSQVAGLQ